MTGMVALVTGFEPYGGFGDNPSGQVAAALHGQRIGSVSIASRILPVRFRDLGNSTRDVLAEVDPVAVVNLGQAPGETTVRLERVAVNVADFAISDNAGERVMDQAVDEEGVAALFSTLPLAEIRNALLGAGIPATVSNSAGTYLCNAAMYEFLRRVGQGAGAPPCGFIHLPSTPQQVAAMLASGQIRAPAADLPSGSLASMELETMVEAVRLALEICVGARPSTT